MSALVALCAGSFDVVGRLDDMWWGPGDGALRPVLRLVLSTTCGIPCQPWDILCSAVLAGAKS